MEEILIEIAKLAPVVGLLVYAVWWMNKLITKKDDTIEILNTEIKEGNKENLSLLYKVLGFFEKLEDKGNTQHDNVLNEIKMMREVIEEKLKKD